MDFDLHELHRTVVDTTREFARAELAPAAARADGAAEPDAPLVGKLAELGMLGARVPEDHEGAGLDLLAFTLMVEELAAADGGVALVVAVHNALAVEHLHEFGPDALRHDELPALATGQRLASWPLACAPGALGTLPRAERDGEQWVLSGTLSAVAPVTAGVHLIPAVTDPHAPSASVATFATASDSPGLSTSRMGGLGCRAAAMGDLVLDGVRVDDSRRIDAEGRGSADLEHVVDRGRIALAALALGLGEGALAAAAGYAKDRTQFGQPIADFQAIQWMIADARAGLDSARMLVRRGAWIADRGDPLGQAAAQARLRATEAASSACHQALQVHGGYGYTREFPVERLLRDVTVCRTALGGTDPDRQDVARSILEA